MAKIKEVILKYKKNGYQLNKKLRDKILKALEKGKEVEICAPSFTGHDSVIVEIKKRKKKICVDHISSGMRSENMAGFYEEFDSWKELKDLLNTIYNTPDLYI